MARPVVLSGFMATGKSTLGRKLADELALPFVDTDLVLEERTGLPTGELFAREGEARFRERELSLVRELLDAEFGGVLSLGGGAVTTTPLRHLVLERGLVITLTASPDAIAERAASGPARPNLAGHDPRFRAAELLRARAHAYAECHASLDTERLSLEEQVAAVQRLMDRRALAVPLGSRSYCVDVVAGDPALARDRLEGLAPTKILCVTDAHVAAARGAAIDALLKGLEATRVVLTPGEASKTMGAVAQIWDAALAAGLDRRSVVVAFGGGVVGDLAGFAAATLLRGVRFLQVPTTLLAMADSSVGGKTGFDHPRGKNLIGAFHQPSAVVVDVAHLETLPARERACGLAEIAKIALARDRSLFEELEGSAEALCEGRREALVPVLEKAILGKIRLVRDDEHELGPRALLNLGHTVGHALEAHAQYTDLLHGEAVAIGTMVELAATEALGFTGGDVRPRVSALWARLGLPVAVDAATLRAALPLMATDKKRAGAAIKLPAVRRVGEATVENVAMDRLVSALSALP